MLAPTMVECPELEMFPEEEPENIPDVGVTRPARLEELKPPTTVPRDARLAVAILRGGCSKFRLAIAQRWHRDIDVPVEAQQR